MGRGSTGTNCQGILRVHYVRGKGKVVVVWCMEVFGCGLVWGNKIFFYNKQEKKNSANL